MAVAIFATNLDGSLWAWGDNWQGRLGVGSTAEVITVPTQVGIDTDWKYVQTFHLSTFALKQDGSLWAWGDNWQGMLGVESTAELITVPTQVGTDTDWKTIYNGGFLAFALKLDGTLWAWGDNWQGTLGVGSTAEVITVPTQVGTNTEWKSVTTHNGVTFAQKQDGSLWAWGLNGGGQLGVGSTAETITVPTQVGDATDWKYVQTFHLSTFALKQDGSLWAWGGDEFGELGVESTTQDIAIPTQVGTDTDWKSVNTFYGSSHVNRSTFALKQDGSLWAWGRNVSGSLGLGSPAEIVTTPTQVGTDTNWGR